jgi:hypothetical protein
MAVLMGGVLFAAACTDGGSGSGAASGDGSTTTTPATSTTTAAPRPEGPAADMSEEITVASNPFMGAATPANLEASGYVEREYIAAGKATSYKATDALTADGKWTFAPDTEAAYRTRVLVRRPKEAKDFSGTVLVEWLNVSGGVDANPDYGSTEEAILRRGDVWVGVSTQLIGVVGGPVLVSAPGANSIAGKGLKAIDPLRYATLEHPGDGFSFDMFTQVARALRDGTPALVGLEPKHLIALGESQSAIALTTYYNGVQPLTQAFDGFFIHSRAATALPLVGPGAAADLAGSFGGVNVLFRSDLAAPVMELQAEGDLDGVLNSLVVRQEDSEVFRLWEVAGTAHADRHVLGPLADMANCGVPINSAPFHIVTKAALVALEEWVSAGSAPPKQPRIEITSDAKPKVRRDANGIALGGIRTPTVDVPVDVLSGNPGPSADVFCLLLGSTTPLSDATLASMYSSREDYVAKFAASTDEAIKQGAVLKEDRDAMIAYSQAARIAG